MSEENKKKTTVGISKIIIAGLSMFFMLIVAFIFGFGFHWGALYIKSVSEKALEEWAQNRETQKIEKYYTKIIPVAQTNIKFQDINFEINRLKGVNIDK